ncbi:MAG: hypothetical protein A2Y97_00250 [Nitrospirae bacterium RBG_13_39_12]|nr:MAG: hypothetical protein A2Y97_00250 [Nitrospirae bacterium RBG_13_39_12]
MNCEWVRNNISAYIDHELSEYQKEMVRSHLLQCPECKAEFNRLSMAWDSLKLWEDKQPPLYLKEAIIKNAKKEKYSRILHIFVPVAAVLVITFVTVFFYSRNEQQTRKALMSENKRSLKIESVKLDENEIIKNLQLIEEQEFFESVEILRTIEYLPIIEEDDYKKTSIGYFLA